MGLGTLIFGREGSYRRNLWISLDQFLNVLWGGKPDETWSSRLGRAKKRREAGEKGVDPLAEAIEKPLCEALDRVDPGHCETSVEFTEEGKPDPHHLGKKE